MGLKDWALSAHHCQPAPPSLTHTLLPSCLHTVGRMPLVIGSLDRAVCGNADLELLQAQQQQG